MKKESIIRYGIYLCLAGLIAWLHFHEEGPDRGPFSHWEDRAAILEPLRSNAPSEVRIYLGVPRKLLMLKEPLGDADFLFMGERFKRRYVTATAEQSVQLRHMALSEASFEGVEEGALKMCGGFHGDVLVQYRFKDQPSVYLILCYGCGEAKFYRLSQQIYADQTLAAEELATLLSRMVGHPNLWEMELYEHDNR